MILGPFVVDAGYVCHGVDSRRRIAIVDQTPNHNLLCFILPEYAEEICRKLNEEKPSSEAMKWGGS